MSTYAQGIKEASRLDTESGKKANVLQKAYEAAVAESGYSDKEMMDTSKAKTVAKLMFGDKYLGNAKFNPLLKDEQFGKKSYIEQQQQFEHMLGINLDNFVRSGGIIERYGGLRRTTLAEAVERQYSSDTAQKLMSFVWNQTYDPKKSLGENVEAYVKVLQEDPILAHTGAKINPAKFDSIDEVAQAAANSMLGRSNRELFQYKYGAEFN